MSNKAERIKLYRTEYEKMLSEALKERPNEACGLIAGKVSDDGIKIVSKVYLLHNTDQSAEHFRLDPEEQLAAVNDMRKHGLEPFGNWHSHPETPSRPSEEDIRFAYDRNAVYMILSLAKAVPELNGFHIENGEVRKEILEVIEGE